MRIENNLHSRAVHRRTWPMVSIQKKKKASSTITENLSNKKYLLYDPIFVKKKKKITYNMCTYISLYKHNMKSGRIHSKSLIVMAEGGWWCRK